MRPFLAAGAIIVAFLALPLAQQQPPAAPQQQPPAQQPPQLVLRK